jgi:hypothetical protein
MSIKNKLDLFAEPILFTFRKQTLYRTIFGGCASLIIIIFGILLGYLLISNVFVRDIPKVTESKMEEIFPLKMNFIKDENFNFPNITYEQIENLNYNLFYNGIKVIQGTNDQLIDDFKRYVNIEFNQIEIKNETTIKRELNFELCKKFANFDKLFIELELNKAYCLNDNFTLSGNHFLENSTFLEINISKCNNKTAEKKGYKCLQKSEIEKKLLDSQIEWYYNFNSLNTTNYENIIGSQIKDRFWDLVSSTTKISKFKFSYNLINSYDSILPDFLFASKKELKTLYIEEEYSDYLDIDKDETLLKIYFIPSENYTISTRRYLNIFTEISAFGGILDVIYSIGLIFIFIFAKESFNEDMVRDFYDLNDGNFEKEDNLQFEFSIRNIYNTHRNFSFNEILKIIDNDIYKKNAFNGTEINIKNNKSNRIQSNDKLNFF